MRVKISKREGYKCAPLGHTVEFFEFGEIVNGQAAEYALADKAGARVFDKPSTAKPAGKRKTKSVKEPLENKGAS